MSYGLKMHLEYWSYLLIDLTFPNSLFLTFSFSSGGEDGYVRLHHFDPDYFNIKI